MEQAPLDILTDNVGDVVRRAKARELGAELVQAVFRLVKVATLHAMDNQAVARQIEDSVRVVNDYGQRADRNASILFARGSVFVAGQYLKANRQTYEEAVELGELLRKLDIGEIGIARDVRAGDLVAFAKAIGDALRTGRKVGAGTIGAKIRLRPVADESLLREMAADGMADDVAIARTYAAAVVIMRRFYEDLARGRYVLPQRVKRIAQCLVDLSAGGTPAFLGVTAARNANGDDAGRAVNTAILSLAMARQITSDPVMLLRVALAALLFDTARPRLTDMPARGGRGVVPVLSADQDAEVPAGTAVVVTALGRVNEPSVVRTVIAYEGQWIKRTARLGALYGGLRTPVIQARIVHLARSFNDLLTPAPGQTPMSADEAIAGLETATTEAADRTVLRLLVAALGIFPTGTLVELSTGEVALVVRTPANPSLYSLPRVRLVFDAAGGAIARPVEVDLAQPPGPGEPRRLIKGVVATSDDPSASSMRSLAKSVPAPAPASGVRDPSSAVSATSAVSAASAASAGSVASAASGGLARHAAPGPDAAAAAMPAAIAPGRQSAPAPAVFAPLPNAAPRNRAPAADARARAALEASEPGSASRDPASVASGIAASPPTGSPRTGGAAPRAAEAASPLPAAPPGTQPTAQGDMQRTPLVHLLVYMLDQGLTGTTVFQTPERSAHAVYFERGVPCKIRTTANVAPLDRMLLELGLLDEETLRASLIEISRTKTLHGRHLVARGFLDRETVLSVLRLQLVRKLMYLFELAPETRYAYYENVNLLATYGGPELVPCDPLAVIMAGVRLRGDDPLVEATLARIGHRPMGLHAGGDIRRFELQRDENVLVELLRARRHTIAELIETSVAPPRVARLTIYALAITRHLDFGVPGRPPVGVDSAAFVDLSALPTRTSPPRDAPVVRPSDRPDQAGAAGADASPAAARARDGGEPAIRAMPAAPVVTQPPPSAAPTVVASSLPTSDPRARAAAPSAPAAPSSAPGTGAPSSGGAPQRPRIGPQDVAPGRAARTGFGIRFGQPASGPAAQSPAPPAASSGQAASSVGARAPTDAPSAPRTSAPPVGRASIPSWPGEAPSSPRGSMPSWPGEAPSGPRSYPSPIPDRPSPVPSGRASTPSYRPGASPVPPPRGSSPSIPDGPISYGSNPPSGSNVSARRAEIELRAKSIDSENFFQMLGLSTTATAEDIQGAYFALARKWHPDRQPSDLADVKPHVARVFGRLSEAYHTLSDTRRRSEYQHLVAAGGGSPDEKDKIARVVDAALEFQKAEVLLRKHDFVGAEVLARRAVEADPEQPEYRTLLVWVQAQRRGEAANAAGGNTTSVYDDLIKQLDEVLKDEPHYERALYYRGMLLKRAGKLDKAMRDLRLAAEINPKNIDAIREVRLFNMRNRGRTAPPPSGSKRPGTQRPGPPSKDPSGGGLFGKFFKK